MGQETSCPERQEHERKSEVVHHLTGKLFPRDMMQSSVLHHKQDSVTSHCSFFKTEKSETVFHQSAPHGLR
jgi:hypothetical protein